MIRFANTSSKLKKKEVIIIKLVFVVDIVIL